MKTQTGVFLAVAMGLAALAGPTRAQDSGSVVIYRGAQVETVRFDNRSGVTVVRGEPAAKPVEPAYPAVLSGAGRIVAGDTLWIVDEGDRRIVACELRRTTQVGGRRIRCIDRALPIALR